MMVPIFAPPERSDFTRQPTVCDQALQPNDGILPGNRQSDGILPGIREDEVEENCDWCEGYYMNRDTAPIEDPILVLPIKERRRRSLIEIAEACGNSQPRSRSRSRLQTRVATHGLRPGFPNFAQQRLRFDPSHPFANVAHIMEHARNSHFPSFSNSDYILDMVKSCVPELDREGLQDANRTILDVQTQRDIQFLTNYMAMSDTQMVRAFARQAKRSLTGRYYVGITEHPVRRLRMHADHHTPFIHMLIVRVALTSSETAYWEKLAIRHFREELGHHIVLNVGDGGERASAGIPHYGYILRCR